MDFFLPDLIIKGVNSGECGEWSGKDGWLLAEIYAGNLS